jgi:acetyltransferase-like isoleucine patch superfamily enzyme/glycosyltransferase involved in cell wall biosynthesis
VKRILLVTTDADRIRREYEKGGHPRVDFIELAAALDARILSYADLNGKCPAIVRLTRRLLGDNWALALFGTLQKADSIFTTAENTGMALALMLRFVAKRPSHVMISHKLSAGKKKWIFRFLGLLGTVDGLIAYTSEQTRFAGDFLGFEQERLHRIHFFCDHRFFTPPETETVQRAGLVSVGRELRDYPTLIEAVRGLDVKATIVGTSPWSKRADLLDGLEIPPNVELKSGLSYEELRGLYRESELAVVPLQDVDSPAGVTSIFEALATETPALVSRTCGIADSIADCDGVETVTPEDPAALREAIVKAVADSVALAAAGKAGRKSIENERSLEHFVTRIGRIVRKTTRNSRKGVIMGMLDKINPMTLFNKAWPIVSAKICFRKCDHVGRKVRNYGKPRVYNKGRIEIGDRSLLYSMTVRSEYVTHPGGKIEIGEGVFINYGASISSHELVRIGSGCQIAQYAILMDNDYHRAGNLSEAGDSKPIILGNNVWLGARVTVLKGVEIGENSVIGAGSVVTKSIPANCLAGGVPAKVIRQFESPAPQEEKTEKESVPATQPKTEKERTGEPTPA